MTQEAKVLAGIGLITLLIIGGAVFFLSKSSPTPTNPEQINAENSANLIRDFNHKIATDSAKVNIVEFSDFQCPACKMAEPIRKQILGEYAGKVNFIYRHFPLPQHQNAKNAVSAAEAAGLQGKFWEMHDKLFETQLDWENESNPLPKYLEYARELSLDLTKFNQDYNAKPLQKNMDQDISDGMTLGINSTPTFFVGNAKLPGVPNTAEFKSLIDQELGK